MNVAVYMKEAVCLPPGLLVGSGLLVRRLQVKMSSISQRLYGELTASSSVLVFRTAAHNFEAGVTTSRVAEGHSPSVAFCRGAKRHIAAGSALALAAVDSPRLSQISVLGTSRPTHLCEISRREPLPGMLMLQLTVKTISELSMHLRCTACGKVREGSACHCAAPALSGAGSNGAASFETEMQMHVTDGTGVARLVVQGRLVWAVLNATAADAARAATARCGPLRCSRPFGSQKWWRCISDGSGQWQCGAGLNLDANARSALTAMWPTAASWQREVIAHCKASWAAKDEGIKMTNIHVSSVQHKTMLPVPDPKWDLALSAYELAPLAARTELERALQAGVDGDAQAALYSALTDVQ